MNVFSKEYTSSIALQCRSFPVGSEGDLEEDGFWNLELAGRANFTFTFTGYMASDHVDNEHEDKIECWPETLSCEVTCDELAESIFAPAYLQGMIEQLKNLHEVKFHKHIEEETD